MRILTHTASLDPIGGIELSTVQDVTALTQRGHHFDLFYGFEGRLRERYERAGVRLHGPVDFSSNPRHPVREILKHVPTARLARTFDSDVMWLRRFEQIAWGQTVATLSHVPIVCHLHHRPMFRLTAPRALGVRHFIAVSEYLKAEWSKAGIAPERITVVHNALPEGEYPRGGAAERASARATLGLPADAPIALYYGRLLEEKGVGVLLDAWQRVRSRIDGALLVVVGDAGNPEASALTRRLDDLEERGVARFELQDNVVPFLHASDVVVFPTLMREGFGRVAIEALASGRPVVASRIGAVPEILFGDMATFLVDPGDEGDLAERIVAVLGWRDSDPGLEARCADWVTQHFPYAQHVTRVEETLQRHARRR